MVRKEKFREFCVKKKLSRFADLRGINFRKIKTQKTALKVALAFAT